MSGAPSSIPGPARSPSGLSSNFTFSFVAKFGGQGQGRALLSPAKVKISLAHAPDTLKL